MLFSRTRLALPGLLGLVLSLGSVAAAQVEHGGAPPSQRRAMRRATPTARMRPVRADLLLAEDEAQSRKEALRFAEVLDVELSLQNSGVWEELRNGDRVWRLRIESPGAYSLALAFSRFQLPAGGELYVYDDRREVVRGAYTELENRLDGQFAIQPTRGEAVTLEYYEPRRVSGLGEIVLTVVAHDYRNILDLMGPQNRSGTGASQSCEVNVACPLGAPWANQVNAAVKVTNIPAGIICSGSLLNNTANDGTVLLLSAAHCAPLGLALFTFNYQCDLCRQGTELTTGTVLGATQLVFDDPLDVQLVRLDLPLGPQTFPVYAAGWDRSDVPPTSSVIIHHPGGDVKKISRDDGAPVIFQNFWRIKDWEKGVTEGGSSGAPMFDPNGRFIGNLDSGASSCAVPTADDFATRLAAAWPLLEPYLDPLGTGQLTTDGLDLSSATAQPFDAVGAVPAAIVSLLPGTRRPVRVFGAGMTAATQLDVDGTPLPSTRFVNSGHSWLNVDLPQLSIGPHTFGVLENGVTKLVPFSIIAPPEPVVQVGGGDLGESVFSRGIDVLHADTPGHVHYCFWSLSNVPSLGRFVTLNLGNGFTNLSWCRINPIPDAGWTVVHHTPERNLLPPGTHVYTQSVCRGHGLPLHTSNLQETVFEF